MTEREKITVYIPCHNAERFLDACLEAVFDQSLAPAEVIVINDASTDRTVEIAEKYPVKVIHLPSHPGLAAARNAAVAAASHNYIAALDADCIAEPTWLEALMKAVVEKGADGAGGKLVEVYQDTLADRWRAVHMRQNWGEEKIVDPPFLFGCNTLFRKRALEAVGLYDTGFRSNGEDVDISNRLKAKEYMLLYEPSAVVRHLKRDTIFSVLKADWNWGYVTTGNTMKYERNSNIVYQNFSNAKYRFLKDRSSRRHELLILDIMLFFAHTHWDIRYAQESGIRKKSYPGMRSAIETLSTFTAHLARLSESRFLRNPDSVVQSQKVDRPGKNKAV